MTKCLLCSRHAYPAAFLSATMGHAMSSECLASGDVYAQDLCLQCTCFHMAVVLKAQAICYQAELMSHGFVCDCFSAPRWLQN